MKQRIADTVNKHMDIILYAVFGVLTTVVNIVVYWIAAHPLALPVMVSTIIAWIAAVLFAYLTNRKWVFHSQAKTTAEVIRSLFPSLPAALPQEWLTGRACLSLLI